MAAKGSIKRARRRGAAMVEAVVVIPFFIIIFASMIYVGQLYGEKQRTLRQAKEYAWTYAMSNCESGPNASAVDDGSATGDLSGASADVSMGPSDSFTSAPGGDKLTEGWGMATSTVTGSVTASTGIGGYTNQLSTTTRVQCNEKPQDGNLRGVFGFAWDMYKRW